MGTARPPVSARTLGWATLPLRVASGERGIGFVDEFTRVLATAFRANEYLASRSRAGSSVSRRLKSSSPLQCSQCVDGRRMLPLGSLVLGCVLVLGMRAWSAEPIQVGGRMTCTTPEQHPTRKPISMACFRLDRTRSPRGTECAAHRRHRLGRPFPSVRPDGARRGV